MKKLNLSVFLSMFGIVALLLFSMPMKQFDYMTSYKMKKGKGDKTQLARAQAEERERLMRNVTTGKVDPKDWYIALSQINNRSKGLHTRDGELTWEQVGADQVGGRSRGFIFDNTNPKRCYVGAVSGGIFVSDNLGEQWRPVDSLADSLKLMAIGCMTQSINGDIYAGTGEYWGGTPGGDFGSQFYGNGIYKKEANSDLWTILPSTITNNLTNAQNNGNFQQVIDITCDPKENDIVYAGTTKGLFKSTDAGVTWTNILPNKIVGQVKIGSTSGHIFVAANGELLKSTNDGASFTVSAPAIYKSESNNHMRIAIGKNDDNKIYVCGITSRADLKFMIKSEDGGTTWSKLGEGDAFLNPLCADIDGARQCQGYYDMCLATHPKDDDIVFLGGMSRLYSWSKANGWIQSSYGYSPAILGSNELHSDMHEIAFHKNSDTMVVVCDGGVYMSTNSYKDFPANIVWRPKNNQYNVTQYYDMDVTRYGELIGGAQDNGTQFVSLRGSSSGLSAEVGGGDGFDVAISANKDYQIAFGSVYYGSVNRTLDLSATAQSISTGHCADIKTRGSNDSKPDGKFDDVGFHTRLYLAEDITDAAEGEIDEVNKSFMFVFNQIGGMYVSNNATAEKGAAVFTQGINPGVGTIYCGHHSKDLKSVYFGGASGLKRLNNLPDVRWDSLAVQLQPCIKPEPALSFSSTTGVPGSIGGVCVDPKDANHVVAVQFGFGGTNKVFESTNGLKFDPKQGNLPVMPIYCCAINPDDSKNVFVGTEFGIWETKDITASSPDWTEQNRVIGRVPVFALKAMKLRSAECHVLYAGTHGRGFFRLPLSQDASCDYTLKPRNPGNPVSIHSVRAGGINFNIYPNPASDVLSINFSSRKPNLYALRIYDMNGKMVKNTPYRITSGDNVIKTDISFLRNGNYIVRLEDENSVIGGKILTKN